MRIARGDWSGGRFVQQPRDRAAIQAELAGTTRPRPPRRRVPALTSPAARSGARSSARGALAPRDRAPQELTPGPASADGHGGSPARYGATLEAPPRRQGRQANDGRADHERLYETGVDLY